MDSLLSASLELDKRHQKHQETVNSKLDDFHKTLEKMKQDINNDPSQTRSYLEILREKAQKLQFQKSQKDFQSTLSKFGKDIDKKFKQDISVIYQPDSFAGKEYLMQRALAMHFIRQGQFDMCDTFMTEMKTSYGTLPDTDIAVNDPVLIAAVDDLKTQFRQMYMIIQQLGQEHHLDQAIQWAQEHRQELNALSSSLEFNLHRLRFIQLLLSHQPLEAIMYGRRHFSQFGDKHFSEIMRLMTCTIYTDIESSPYRYLCSPSLWMDIQHEFQRDFCSLLNMSAESPLYASVYVGTTALPSIMKLHKIMAAKRAEWSQQDELPVEVPMDDDLRFHSVFACPVSKEQATDSNPPMMMPCGHVICKESLTRLSRNSRYGRNAMRFKCPYCPSESGVDEAVQVIF
ncbi:CTLH/CRA C-terminal to lish motif domain-containing protein [Halteromyces radiatus]|uniref:CTLH/CRA C-terminal to lish motif domain-containing protein n=1 Tax=Halteromyces radiatus TaxID=101107 RepID=UPI00221FCB80|nr:CTLH/CRA C-terminal to lish motif domain-containing protein [Halteromyces radiatus]KAI8092822.1 CTLH/CRA C-terminal to lish motif domain-containing protein [Halteromyces radiatus]